MSKSSSHILLVAGDEDLRWVLHSTLRDLGYSVTSCKSSEEALRCIQRNPPDVAITSLDSPRSGLLDLQRALKAVDPDSAIILLEGDGGSGAGVMGEGRGAIERVASPVVADDVAAKARNALNQRSLHLENLRLAETLEQANLELDKETSLRRQAEEALGRRTQELERSHQQGEALAGELARESSIREGLEEGLARSEELRRLQAAWVTGDHARKRLAERLHDDIMASLLSIAVDLGFLRWEARNVSEELEEGMARLGARLKDTDHKLKEVVWGIFPSVLTNLGLVPAIRSYLEQLSSTPVSNTPTIKIDLKTRGFDNSRLPEEVEIGLYRVAQQGVDNAIEHARAKTLLVDLTWVGSELTLFIADDGVGFDIERTKENLHWDRLGLAELSDRVEALRGSLSIDSELSVGTTIRVRIPTSVKSMGTDVVQTSSYMLDIKDPAQEAR